MSLSARFKFQKDIFVFACVNLCYLIIRFSVYKLNKMTILITS